MAREYKVTLFAALLLLLSPCAWSSLSDLEQIDIKTFENMREVERYQIKIAEKHYTKGDFKLALIEYEKFITLYENSPGAPYAQLMWSHCQLKLKKPVAAMREGFQSVIDYWPDSREANIAAYCMGNAYKKMGEVKKATESFNVVIEDYPQTHLALRATHDLLHYAKLHKDQNRVMDLLGQLTYDWKRDKWAKTACFNASRELALIHFNNQAFSEGRRALATSYKDEQLNQVVFDFTVKTVQHLLKKKGKRSEAIKLGDQLIARLHERAKQNPDQSRPILYRACDIHSMLGRPSDVINIYEDIAKRLGRDDDILGRMAKWQLSRKQTERAIELYNEFKDQVAGQEAIAQIYTSQGKLEAAIAVYSTLLDLNGAKGESYKGSIAKCYEGLKEWRKAIQMYRQMEGFPGTHFSMAHCHRQLKEYKDAIALYEQCKVVDNAAPRASLYIGYTYEQAKEKEKAIRTFQMTCKRYPKSRSASSAHSHLQNKYNIHVTLGGAEDE